MARTLLPPGCYDKLPPAAKQETRLLANLLAAFECYGYAQVAPPLLEYTESLLAGRGGALYSEVFRVMDPLSHKMMGIRADHTMQIGRIASTRMADDPLPLRLSYTGPVLHAQMEKQGGSRERKQAGIELIGSHAADADAEVIYIAAEALEKAGIHSFIIDLNLPMLVAALLSEEALSEHKLTQVYDAISHKDVTAIAALELETSHTLAQLVSLGGPARETLKQLQQINLPATVSDQIDNLAQVIDTLERLWQGKEILLMLDPTESRGFEYHTGITFSIFSTGAITELARGGRYAIEMDEGTRPATGVTFYIDTLCTLLPDDAPLPRVFIADNSYADTLASLHEQGFVTVFAVPDIGTSHDHARDYGCSHYFKDGKLEEL